MLLKLILYLRDGEGVKFGMRHLSHLPICSYGTDMYGFLKIFVWGILGETFDLEELTKIGVNNLIFLSNPFIWDWH